MLIWLLVLLLLFGAVYLFYRAKMLSTKTKRSKEDHHYTFKI